MTLFQTAQSPLSLLLQNIGSIVTTYSNTMTSAGRVSLLKAIESESTLVTRKLQAMHRRWLTYLPFHEVIDVKFIYWVEECEKWIETLQTEAEVPSTGFVLDLIHSNGDSDGISFGSIDELKKEVPVYCEKIDKLLAKTYLDWEEVYSDGFDKLTTGGDGFDELKNELNTNRENAVSALAEMRKELNELEDFFSSELKPMQFITLALRLHARDCKKVEKEAKAEVVSEHNSWPEKYVKERAKDLKDKEKLKLLKNDDLELLQDYVNLDDPKLYDDPCFGQFLFKSRHKLAVEDVKQLVKSLEKIRLYNEYIDPSGSKRKREKDAQGRELSDEEKKIVKLLTEFVKKVEWRSGATQDSVSMGINKMLGVGYNLEPDMQLLSDHLWKLLKNRNRCDADKSLKVTWLNIVGWCVNKGIISGTSPTLCKLFFPRCGQDDYKAIDKGRKEPPVQFQKIMPLLERFMK